MNGRRSHCDCRITAETIWWLKWVPKGEITQQPLVMTMPGGAAGHLWAATPKPECPRR